MKYEKVLIEVFLIILGIIFGSIVVYFTYTLMTKFVEDDGTIMAISFFLGFATFYIFSIILRDKLLKK